MGFADEVNASSFVSTLPRVSLGEACAGWHDEAASCAGFYRCVVAWVNLVKGRSGAEGGAGRQAGAPLTAPRPAASGAAEPRARRRLGGLVDDLAGRPTARPRGARPRTRARRWRGVPSTKPRRTPTLELADLDVSCRSSAYRRPHGRTRRPKVEVSAKTTAARRSRSAAAARTWSTTPGRPFFISAWLIHTSTAPASRSALGGVRQQLRAHVVDAGLEEDVVAGGRGRRRRRPPRPPRRRRTRLRLIRDVRRVDDDGAQHVGPAGHLAAAGAVARELDAARRADRLKASAKWASSAAPVGVVSSPSGCPPASRRPARRRNAGGRQPGEQGEHGRSGHAQPAVRRLDLAVAQRRRRRHDALGRQAWPGASPRRR